MRPVVDFHHKLIEQGVREGVFRPISTMEFYFILTGACDTMFWRRNVWQDVFGVTELTDEIKRDYARAVTSVVLNGITASRT